MGRKENFGLIPNIGTKERVGSLISGSYLLYNALAKEEKSWVKGFTAGYMLFRGITGYCAFNSAIGIKEVEMRNDINIKTNLIVSKPRKEVYDFWRKLENLPKIMEHLENVTTLDEKISEWEAKIPGGIGTIKWKSEIIEDIPNELISWQSLPNSTIVNVGSVRFLDARESETEVQVDITYRAPLGIPGKRIAKMLNPVFADILRGDIRNFRRIIETGEVPATNGHPY